jgi:hypothetical protein
MAKSLAQTLAALVAALVLGGCSAAVLAGHYTTHASFDETYRTARTVAIVPPGVEILEHAGETTIQRVSWSPMVADLITGALEAEYEARGLAVVRVEERSETAEYIESVRQGFSSLMLKLTGIQWFGGPWGELSVGNTGPLLEVSGGDLLVVVLAGGVEIFDPGSEALWSIFTLGLHKSQEDTVWIRVGLADRTGRIICFGMADRTNASLRSKKAVADLVGEALEEFPKRK